MFSTHRIRESVKSKLMMLNRVDEETLHILYEKAIQEERSAAFLKAKHFALMLGRAVKVTHESKGWVLVDMADMQALVNMLKSAIEEI